MSIDLPRLASQGRAFSPARAWTPEELDALLLLEKTCALTRLEAADYIRNGVTTPEAFEAAQKASFKPKSIEDAHLEAEASMQAEGASIGAVKKTVKKAKSK